MAQAQASYDCTHTLQTLHTAETHIGTRGDAPAPQVPGRGISEMCIVFDPFGRVLSGSFRSLRGEHVLRYRSVDAEALITLAEGNEQRDLGRVLDH